MGFFRVGIDAGSCAFPSSRSVILEITQSAFLDNDALTLRVWSWSGVITPTITSGKSCLIASRAGSASLSFEIKMMRSQTPFDTSRYIVMARFTSVFFSSSSQTRVCTVRSNG